MKRVTFTLYSTAASDMPCDPNLVSSAQSLYSLSKLQFLNLLVSTCTTPQEARLYTTLGRRPDYYNVVVWPPAEWYMYMYVHGVDRTLYCGAQQNFHTHTHTHTHTHAQDNSDVLGCSVETSTANVRAIDTYNDPDRNSRSNLLDSSGQLQVTHSHALWGGGGGGRPGNEAR